MPNEIDINAIQWDQGGLPQSPSIPQDQVQWDEDQIQWDDEPAAPAVTAPAPTGKTPEQKFMEQPGWKKAVGMLPTPMGTIPQLITGAEPYPAARAAGRALGIPEKYVPEPGKALVEGYKEIVKAPLQLGQALFDVYAEYTGDDPNEALRRVTKSDSLLTDADFRKRQEEKAGVTRYLEDVVGMAPQIATQWAAHYIGGPWLSGAWMGVQIAGPTYERLREEGVDPKRAFAAAIANAAAQAPLEAIQLGFMFRKLGEVGTKAVIRRVLEGGGSEFLTEWIQQYPELLTGKWAKKEKLTKKDWADATVEGMYQGLVAAPFGILGGGAKAKSKKSDGSTDLITGETDPPPDRVGTKKDAEAILNAINARPYVPPGEAAPVAPAPVAPAPVAPGVAPAPILPAAEQVGQLYGVEMPETARKRRIREVAQGALQEPAPITEGKPTPYTTKEKIAEVEKYGRTVYAGGAFVEPVAEKPAKMAEPAKAETFDDYVGTLTESEKISIKDLIKDTSMSDAERLTLAKTEILAGREKAKVQYQKELLSAEKQKGQLKVHGYTAIVETPKGEAVVEGVPVKHPVGVLKETKDKEGQPLKVVMGPEGENTPIFVVAQMDNGKFVNNRVMMGFATAGQARMALRTSFGKAAEGRVIEMSKNDFDRWVRKADKTRPASEQPPISEAEWMQRPEVRPPGYQTKKFLPGAKGQHAQITNRTILAEYRQWLKNMGYSRPSPTQVYEKQVAAERVDKRPAPIRYLEEALLTTKQQIEKKQAIVGEKGPNFLKDVVAGSFQEHTKLNADQKLARWLADILGIDLSFFTGPNFNSSGVFIPGPNTIAINANTEKPAIFILMHEVTHNMREEDPKTYKDLKKYLWKVRIPSEYLLYADYLNSMRDAEGSAPLTINPFTAEGKSVYNSAFDEYMAEGIAHFAFKEEFWNTMQKKNPSLFGRFVNWITKVINKIRAKESKTQTQDLNFFYSQSLEGVTMEKIVNAFNSFAKRRIRAPLKPTEKIESSAIITSDNKLFTGIAHWDAWEKAREAEADLTAPIIEGFVTNYGSFVDRVEAQGIAEAAKQLNARAQAMAMVEPQTLSSEDIQRQHEDVPSWSDTFPGEFIDRSTNTGPKRESEVTRNALDVERVSMVQTANPANQFMVQQLKDGWLIDDLYGGLMYVNNKWFDAVRWTKRQTKRIKEIIVSETPQRQGGVDKKYRFGVPINEQTNDGLRQYIKDLYLTEGIGFGQAIVRNMPKGVNNREAYIKYILDTEGGDPFLLMKPPVTEVQRQPEFKKDLTTGRLLNRDGSKMVFFRGEIPIDGQIDKRGFIRKGLKKEELEYPPLKISASRPAIYLTKSENVAAWFATSLGYENTPRAYHVTANKIATVKDLVSLIKALPYNETAKRKMDELNKKAESMPTEEYMAKVKEIWSPLENYNATRRTASHLTKEEVQLLKDNGYDAISGPIDLPSGGTELAVFSESQVELVARKRPENSIDPQFQYESIKNINLNTSFNNYSEASDNVKDSPMNILVRPGGKQGKYLFVQISSGGDRAMALSENKNEGLADEYFNKLYKTRDGYVRPADFWEIPEWVGMAAKTFTDSDFYVVRSLNEAKAFLAQAGYDKVFFSVMDANKVIVKDIVSSYRGDAIVSGYVRKDYFKENKNATWVDSIEEAAKSVGVKYQRGVDYKHFKGVSTIPRLELSRGCLHNCAFCVVPKDIIEANDDFVNEQIDAFKNLKFKLIYLNDKTFGQAKNYTKLQDIFNRIKKMNPDFQGFIIQTTAPAFLGIDSTFILKSGIKYVELGVETYNDDILKKLKKPHNTMLIDRAVNKIRNLKLNFVPNIMVGLAGVKDGKLWTETSVSYKNTLDFLKKNSDIISHANVYVLATYEGTTLAGQLGIESQEDADENVIEKSWLKNKSVHEKFYKDVLNFASGQLETIIERFGYFEDNPGGSWLEHEREMAKRSKFGGAVTAGFHQFMEIPTRLVSGLRGMMGEHFTRKLSDPDVQKLMKSIKQEGIYNPIFINVQWNGEAMINEGNRRALIAKELGLESVPVEIRYFAGGERVKGVFNPENIMRVGKVWQRPDRTTTPSAQFQVDFISKIPKQAKGKLDNGAKGTPLGNKLYWMLHEVLDAVKAMKPSKIFVPGMEWRGFKLTEAAIKMLDNQVKKYRSDKDFRKQYDEIRNFRNDISNGLIEYFSDAYEKMIAKYGPKVQLHTLRHRVRFPYSKTQIYGPADDADVKTVVVKEHPILGKFEVEVFTDYETGNEVINGPLFSEDRKVRLQQIADIIKKNSFSHEWYVDWGRFMNQWADKIGPEKIVKYIKIQAILSAQKGPQANQLEFAKVVDLLENGEELFAGGLEEGGSGMGGDVIYKIDRIWKGIDTETTLEEFADMYGDKVGLYMWAGLHPQQQDIIVIDRHMSKPWGYNIMWDTHGNFARLTRAPEVVAEVAGDIMEAARMVGVSNGAAQAALWFEIRKADVEAATYREAAQIKPDEYLPKIMFAETNPGSVGLGIHYKKTLVPAGEFIYAATKDGRIKYNSYSKNDIGKRIDASTEKNPYAELVYAYEAKPGFKPEPHISFGRQPHSIRFEVSRIYDGINDMLGYWKSAKTRVELDDKVIPGLKESAITNAFANLIAQTNSYDGFLYKQGPNNVVAVFGKAAVSQAPESTTIALSDVVEDKENLPQTIKEIEKVLPGRAVEMADGLTALVEKYTPVKIDSIDATVAKFGDVTSGKLEIGAMVRASGPLDAVKAFAADWGVQKAQNYVFVIRKPMKDEAPTGDVIVAPVRKEFQTPADLEAKMGEHGVSNFNIGIKQRSGRLFIERYIPHEGEFAPTDEEIESFVNFIDDVVQPGMPIERFMAVSDILTKDNYDQTISEYFGKREGKSVYEEATGKQEEYIKKVEGREAGVIAPKKGEDAERKDPGRYGEDFSDGFTRQIEVFHGSPFDFDKMLAERIGSGEGAQAFGWGLYFTDLKSIAKHYAKMKERRRENISYRGQKLNRTEFNKAIEADYPYGGAGAAANTIAYAKSSLKGQELQRYLNEYVRGVYGKSRFDVEQMIKDIEVFKVTGVVYKVTLHQGKTPEQYAWMDWYQQISEENKKKIIKYFEDINHDMVITIRDYLNVEKLQGHEVYSFLNYILYNQGEVPESKKATSLALLAAGIDGIRYPAGSLSGGFKRSYASIKREIWNAVKSEIEDEKGFKWALSQAISELDQLPATAPTYKAETAMEIKETLEKAGRADLFDKLVKFVMYGPVPQNYVVFDENAITIEEKVFFNMDLPSAVTPDVKSVIAKKIGPAGKTSRQKVIDSLKDITENWQTRMVDRLHPIKKWLGEGKAYMLARGIPGIQSTFNAFLEHGKLRYDTSGALITDTVNKGFLDWYNKLGEDAEKFFYWVVAKRAQVLKAEEREFLFSDDDIKKILDWVGATPKSPQYSSWDQINREFKEFNENILDIAQASGIIDPAFRSYMVNQGYYVPFYRVLEDDDARVSFFTGKMRPKEISAQIKKLKGSERPIGDPFENMLRNWGHLLNESVHNTARRTAFNYAVRNNIVAYQKEDEATGAMVDVPLIEQVSWADTVRFKKVGKEKGAPTFVSRKDGYPVLQIRAAGKNVYFKVNDTELFNALGQMDTPIMDNMIMKVMSLGKRGLTMGATFGPAFRIKNFLRDTLHTFQISKGFIPLWDSFAGLYKILRKNEDYIRFMASGMAFGGSYLRETDPNSYKKFVKNIVKKEGQSAAKRILDTPRKLLHFWNEIGEGFENAARVQLYSKMKQKGKSHLEAAFLARDLMDFNMSGNGAAVKFLISSVPFMNARMQGLYKMGRAAVEDPGTFFAKSSAIALASLVLWWFNKDDDRYKELEDFEKFAWYHFWIGDYHFRIPKPFETGVLFSTSVEVAGDVITGNEELSHVFKYLADSFSQTLAFNPTPQVAMPIFEQIANKTFFTGRPIESIAMQRREPGKRYDPWDSETLRLLGETLNISPKRAEALIRGYLSTFGMFWLGLSDIMVRNIADFPERPTARVDDYMLVGAFLRQGNNPRYTKYMTKFFDAYREANQLATTINTYAREGDVERARELAKKYKNKVAFRPKLNKTYGELSKISKEMKEVWMSETLNPDQKKQRLDALTQKRNDLVRQVINEYSKGE